MSAYEPPTENLPIFDTVVFGARDEPLTLATASRYFLRYPFAQGTETLKDINVQQITQTANYNYYQSGTGIISQSGTGINQFKDTNIAGALTTREITQDINYNLNQSGTGIISQTGTGTNLLKGITVSGITTLNNTVFVNAQMTTRDIIQSANYSLSQSGAGVISQVGTGTNQLKNTDFVGNITQSFGGYYISQANGTGLNTFNVSTFNDTRGSQNAGALTVTETTSNKSLSVVPNSSSAPLSGRQNEQISTGDTALLAVGSAIDTGVLFLGTWSSTASGCGIRIINNQVVVRGGTNTIITNATTGHTITGTINQATGTGNIISQTGTGTNAFKDSTIPNLTVNTSLDVNGPTTTRAITQDANFNLNQSGTGIISQLGTGTNLLKDTTISGALSATTGDFNSITTGAIVMDIDTNITQSGTGIITQTGTGRNQLKGTDFTSYVGQTITGSGNYQFGDRLSLNSITTGTDNVAFGLNTLRAATTASSNVAIGSGALATKVSGTQCIAIGPSAMGGAVNSISNTIAIGAGAAAFCGGNANVAIGVNAQNTATTAYNSTGVGFGSLQNNNEYQTTAIGRESGRYGYGNNNCFLGYNTGQASTDLNAYTYLTCIGSGSGGTDVASNRIVLGSATGNEEIYLAGNPTIRSSAVTSNASLFPNITTGSVSAGSGLTSGTLQLANGLTTGTVNVSTALAAGGNINIGSSATGGTISVGSTSTTTNIRANSLTVSTTNTTHSGAAAGTVQLANSVTTGTTQIMKDGTTGNLELHNGSASGTGRIYVNRPIRLPTSTSFQNPTSGELGYNYTTGNSVFGVTSGTIYQLDVINLPTGIWSVNVMIYALNTTGASAVITRLSSCVSTLPAVLNIPPAFTLQIDDFASRTVLATNTQYWNYSSPYLSGGALGATYYVNGRLTFTSGVWELYSYVSAARIA